MHGASSHDSCSASPSLTTLHSNQLFFGLQATPIKSQEYKILQQLRRAHLALAAESRCHRGGTCWWVCSIYCSGAASVNVTLHSAFWGRIVLHHQTWFYWSPYEGDLNDGSSYCVEAAGPGSIPSRYCPSAASQAELLPICATPMYFGTPAEML